MHTRRDYQLVSSRPVVDSYDLFPPLITWPFVLAGSNPSPVTQTVRFPLRTISKDTGAISSFREALRAICRCAIYHAHKNIICICMRTISRHTGAIWLVREVHGAICRCAICHAINTLYVYVWEKFLDTRMQSRWFVRHLGLSADVQFVTHARTNISHISIFSLNYHTMRHKNKYLHTYISLYIREHTLARTNTHNTRMHICVYLRIYGYICMWM